MSTTAGESIKPNLQLKITDLHENGVGYRKLKGECAKIS